MLAFTLHILVAFAIPLAAFGIDGWNLPLQINGTTVPYPLTFLEGTLINLGVIYLVLIAMIALTLFLSARMRSPYQVLIVIMPVLFIPMFLTPNGTSGLYNLLVFLTPLPVTETELWIVYILSMWPGRYGRLYNESCFVCCLGADPASPCPDWL